MINIDVLYPLIMSAKERQQISFLGYSHFITRAQPKAGTGLKMQTVRFFNVTLLGRYR